MPLLERKTVNRSIAALLLGLLVTELMFVRWQLSEIQNFKQIASLKTDIDVLESKTREISPYISGQPATAAAAKPKPPYRTGGVLDNKMMAAMAAQRNIRESADFKYLSSIVENRRRDARYAMLFNKLKLNAESLASFKNLLSDKINLPNDVMASVQTQLITRNIKFGAESGSAFRETKAEQTKQLESQIRETIGDAAYTQYMSYEANLPQYLLVKQLQQHLPDSMTQLSGSQESYLLSELLTEKPRQPLGTGVIVVPPGTTGLQLNGLNVAVVGIGNNGYFIDGNGAVYSNFPISEELLTKAAAFLSPRQIAALKEIQLRQAEAHQLAVASHLGF